MQTNERETQNNNPGVYMIKCHANGKVYIGSSITPGHRILSHFSELRHGHHINKYLQADFDSLGDEMFSAHVIENCDESELATKEQFYMDKFNAQDSKHGYNIDNAVRASLDQIKTSMRGRACSEQAKLKISAANAGGKNVTEHQREVARNTCKKRTGANNPMWRGGKTIVNQEHSDRMRGRRVSKRTEFTSERTSGGKNNMAKAVVQLTMDGEFVKQYDYVGGVKADGYCDEGVRSCCKGRQQWYRGYRWMYLSDYEQMLADRKE